MTPGLMQICSGKSDTKDLLPQIKITFRLKEAKLKYFINVWSQTTKEQSNSAKWNKTRRDIREVALCLSEKTMRWSDCVFVQRIFCVSMYSTDNVYMGSVTRKSRRRSVCTKAQVNLSLYCPYFALRSVFYVLFHEKKGFSHIQSARPRSASI